MKYKLLLFIFCTYGILSILSTKSFASEPKWQQNDIGWWYDYGDGQYPVSKWEWIDGNRDGIAECYYFNSTSYLLINTSTPDGYIVNINGAWVENGLVQTQNISSEINVDMGDFIISFPKSWNGHYSINNESDWHWEINFSPLHEYPETLFQIARFKTQQELNNILDFVDNRIQLGYHNGYYYLFCSPTDTALEFYSENERNLVSEMLKDYKTIAYNIQFK